MRVMFIIPGRLPSLNDMIREARGNKFWAASSKKKSQKIIGQYIVSSRIPIFTEPVIISFDWTEPDRRRDIDNVSSGGRKLILDALVQCGKLEDDSRRFIKGFIDQFPEPDKANPHIQVTIETLDESLTEQNGAGLPGTPVPGSGGV